MVKLGATISQDMSKQCAGLEAAISSLAEKDRRETQALAADNARLLAQLKQLEARDADDAARDAAEKAAADELFGGLSAELAAAISTPGSRADVRDVFDRALTALANIIASRTAACEATMAV